MWKVLSIIATIGSLAFGALGLVVEGHDAKEKLTSKSKDDE